MFPQGELKALALQKARLQRRSSMHRAECVEAASAMAQPVAWLDSARAQWSRISPLVKIAGVAASVLAERRLRPLGGGLGNWIRWGLAAVKLARSFARK